MNRIKKVSRPAASLLALLLCVTLCASTAFAAGGALGADRNGTPYTYVIGYMYSGSSQTVPFPVSWTVKMKKKQKETQDILSYHSQAAGCSDKARAKASGGRQPIEECGRTGL